MGNAFSEAATEELGELLRAQIAYVQSLQAAVQEFDREARADNESAQVSAALRLKAGYERFRAFWFDDPNVEALARAACPDLPCFSPLDFEELARDLLAVIEEKSFALTQRSHDQGIDLEFIEVLDQNLGAYAATLVQCKLYRGFVPVAELRDFFGVMAARTATGLFITTGRLTAQGNEFVPLANASPHANRLYVLDATSLRSALDAALELAELYLAGPAAESEEELTVWANDLEQLQKTAKAAIWNPAAKPKQAALF